MRKTLLFCFLTFILVMVPVLGACSNETTTTPAAPASTAKTTTSAAPTTSAAAAASVKINVALSSPLTTIDPTVSGGGGSQATILNVFEPLLNLDTNNKLIPNLVESWSMAADGKSLSMKLYSGLKFSSGDPVTSADVKWTLERYAANPGPTSAQLTQNFSGVEIIDDLNFKFVFPDINVQFLPQTCAGQMFILSKTQYDREGEDGWLKAPAGTGPYKITNWKEGQYVDLTYNDQYRGKKPQITDAHFIYTTDPATRVSQLQAGEVDMIYDVLPSSVAQLANAGYSRFDVVQPHDITLQFAFMTSDLPWSKVEVRKAIDYVIDKDLLNQKLFGGVFQKAVWQMPWELGYDASLDPAYKVDLAKAKDLMSQAGYAKGFEMPLYFPGFMSWGKDMVDYLTSALAQINITVKPMSIADFGSFMGTANKLHADPSQSGVLLFDNGWPGNPDPVINLTNGFYSIKDNTLFKNPDLDALISQALKTIDDTARANLVHQAYQIINDTLPFVPIALEVTVTVAKSNISYTPSVGNANTNSSPACLFDLTVK